MFKGIRPARVSRIVQYFGLVLNIQQQIKKLKTFSEACTNHRLSMITLSGQSNLASRPLKFSIIFNKDDGLDHAKRLLIFRKKSVEHKGATFYIFYAMKIFLETNICEYYKQYNSCNGMWTVFRIRTRNF